jgi:AcrR family transcriptional regulator
VASDAFEPRRSPQRARGVRRVAAILDSAEHVFAEVGYDAATVTAIASHAGIPIGSVYQFYPNKEALLFAVTARYRDELTALIESAISPALVNGPSAVVASAIIDAAVAQGEQHLGLTHMVIQAHISPVLQQAAEQVFSVVIGHVGALISRRYPALGADEAAFRARIVMYAANALLAYALQARLNGDQAQAGRIITEAKTIFAAYLDTFPGADQAFE